MSLVPEFWLIAGPNGAGKTTLPWFAARADRLIVFDNSDSNPDRPPCLIATGIKGNITLLEPGAIPELTAALRRAGAT